MTIQSIIDGAREFVSGVRAIVAHDDPQSWHGRFLDTERLLNTERSSHEHTTRRFYAALANLGVDPDRIPRFLRGVDTDEDHGSTTASRRGTKILELENALEYCCEGLRNMEDELESERAARQKAEAELENEQTAHRFASEERAEAETELTSALETIDALTRKRWQSAEPVPMGVGTVVIYESDLHVGKIWSPAFGMAPEWKWTYTPASWEAARKAGTDAGAL